MVPNRLVKPAPFIARSGDMVTIVNRVHDPDELTVPIQRYVDREWCAVRVETLGLVVGKLSADGDDHVTHCVVMIGSGLYMVWWDKIRKVR